MGETKVSCCDFDLLSPPLVSRSPLVAISLSISPALISAQEEQVRKRINGVRMVVSDHLLQKYGSHLEIWI